VRLIAKSTGGRLVLVVEDSGSGLKTDGADHQGVGLQNVRDRLAYIYRDQAMLRLSALEPTGTCVTVTLPNLSEARA